MHAVSLMAKVYQVLRNAIAYRPSTTSEWASELQRLSDHQQLIRPQLAKTNLAVLSCVAYMESCVDIAPPVLTDAFALTCEDSLFTANGGEFIDRSNIQISFYDSKL